MARADGVRRSRGAGHQPQGDGRLDGRAGGRGRPEFEEHVGTRALVRDIRVINSELVSPGVLQMVAINSQQVNHAWKLL